SVRALDERNGFVAKPAGGREVEEEERPAAPLNRRDEIIEVAPHEQLTAREVNPAELRPAFEEQLDLRRRHLVHALLLPDVAHLAAEVAVIGGDERDLVGQIWRPQVGAKDRPGETSLARQHRHQVLDRNTDMAMGTGTARGTR